MKASYLICCVTVLFWACQTQAEATGQIDYERYAIRSRCLDQAYDDFQRCTASTRASPPSPPDNCHPATSHERRERERQQQEYQRCQDERNRRNNQTSAPAMPCSDALNRAVSRCDENLWRGVSPFVPGSRVQRPHASGPSVGYGTRDSCDGDRKFYCRLNPGGSACAFIRRRCGDPGR